LASSQFQSPEVPLHVARSTSTQYEKRAVFVLLKRRGKLRFDLRLAWLKILPTLEAVFTFRRRSQIKHVRDRIKLILQAVLSLSLPSAGIFYSV